jgi:DNA polymerase I-like protein with 3'-5' exonuclease and polymerase domains
LAKWIRDIVLAGTEIICQNGSFDWGWLGTEWAIAPPAEGKVHDTQAAAVMLDENRLSYGLGSLCGWQGIPGKDKSMLMEAGRALGVGQTDREVMSNLWRLPAKYVGPYAEADAEATLRLWDQMEPQLHAQDLWGAYRLECDLIPMIVAMRRKGIRINTAYVEQQIVEFNHKRDAALVELGRHLTIGRAVDIKDVNSPIFLEKVFTSEGIKFPRTKGTETRPQGTPSFQSEWMEKSDHWLPQGVVNANKYHDAADKFLQGFILDYCHRGRLHADIHHLRSDDEERGFRGGTRSHRFSYSDPPLQQMPSPKRDKEIGLAVRRAFLPEEGEQWYKLDFDQNEYRLLVHFASLMGLPKAEEAAKAYRENPETSFHQLVVDWTGLPKPRAKDCNFAKAYGAGRPQFSRMVGLPQDESDKIYDLYDEELPFVSRLYQECGKTATRRGYIRLVDGARARFDLWEPGWGYKGKYFPPCSRAEGDARVSSTDHEWSGQTLRRAYTHKAMNRLIQGSAARQIKLSARAAWRAGIIPLLQLHDEWDLSAAGDGTAIQVREMMEEAVKLAVPVTAGCDVGPSWGEADTELKRA